jgi:sugar phosphate isomerase/epimerase
VFISLAAATVLDAEPSVAIAAARSAGFDAVGLRFTRPPDVAAVSQLREEVTAAGLRVLDVEVARIGEHTDVTELSWLIDVAGMLGARYLLAVSDDADLGRTANRLAELADRAAPLGVSIALEYMGFTAVRDLAAADRLVTATGRDNVAVLVDVLHLARTGGSPDQLRGPLGAHIGYVQICDAPWSAPLDRPGLIDEARHRRLLPGEGELPVLETLTALGGRPGELAVSVEVQSDLLTATRTPEQRAHAAMQATRALLARVRPDADRGRS